MSCSICGECCTGEGDTGGQMSDGVVLHVGVFSVRKELGRHGIVSRR
jgi:hypothetical protein